MTLLVGIIFIVLAVVVYSAFTEWGNSRRKSEILERVTDVQAVPLSPAANLAVLTLELPDPQRQQAFQLLCLVNDAIESGKYTADSRTSYLLGQTLNSYLPDTLQAYLDLTPGAAERLQTQGRPAPQLLTEQLNLIQDGIEKALRRDHAAADRLLGQGNFLRETFGEVQETEGLKIR